MFGKNDEPIGPDESAKTKVDEEMDALMAAMQEAQALNLKYQALQGKQAGTQDEVSLRKTALASVHNKELEEAAAVYATIIEQIHEAFNEAGAEQDQVEANATQATSDAQHALVAKQEYILEEFGAKVDLLDVKRAPGGIVSF